MIANMRYRAETRRQIKAVDMVAALDEPRLWNSSGIFFRAVQ